MATIPTKKISEITTLLSDLTKETLVAVAEDDGAGGYVTKKVDLRDIDDVQGYTDFASLPATGSTETLYLTTTENKLYFWDGAAYVDLFQAAHMTYDNTTGLTATKVQSAIDELLNIKLDGTDFQQDISTTTGLTFGYKAGKFRNDNAIVSVAAGTVTLTGSATNYVEVDSAGVVSVNTTGFTSGQIPLFEVVTTTGSISSVTDKRSWLYIGLDASNINYDDTESQLGESTTQGAINVIASRTQNTDFVYGIRWDYNNDVIQPGYINFAGTFIPDDYVVFPIQEKMARVLLDSAGREINLNSSDSSKLPNGSDAIIDGSNGYHTKVRIPKHYFMSYTDANYHYILNSESPFIFNGYSAWIPPIFGNSEYRHIGAYEGTAMTDSLTAQVGSVVNAVHHPNGFDTSAYVTNTYPAPFTNRTRGQFRTQCANGVFGQYSWGLHELVMALFVTEYKTFDSQAVLPGHTWRSTWDYAYATKPGETYVLGNSSGSIGTLGSETSNSFRGIENFFGNVWKWVDGININNAAGVYDVYVCHDPANFADDTSTNYQILSGTTDFADSDGYISNLLMNASKYGSFYPTAINGSSSEFVHDYMWHAAGGWRVLGSGGDLHNGAPAGVAALHASYSSGNLYSNFGTRLAAYV